MFNNKERKRLTINRNFVGDYCGFAENPSLRTLVGEWAILSTGRPVDGHIFIIAEGDGYRSTVLVYREEGENRLCSDGDQV